MWFFFGLITLSLSMLSVFLLRRRFHDTGKKNSITVDANGRHEVFNFESKQNTHKGSNTSYFIGLKCPSRVTFAIHRENSFDRFGKRLGVTREFSFHDDALDKALFLDSNDQRIEQMFAAHDDARQALKTLLIALPYSFQLELFEGKLRLHVSDTEAMPAAAKLERLVMALDVIAKATSAFMHGKSKREDPFLWRAGIVLAITMGSAIFGVLAFVRLKSAPQLLLPIPIWVYALITGLLLTALLFVLSWRWLKDSARAHYVLAEVVLLGSVGLALSSAALLREANSDLDSRPAKIERIENAKVVHETYRCGKRKRSTCHRYFVYIPSDVLYAKILSLKKSQYELLQGADTLDVAIKPGLLGVPWVQSIQRAAQAESSG
jgi:phosphate/sulfate permease